MTINLTELSAEQFIEALKEAPYKTVNDIYYKLGNYTPRDLTMIVKPDWDLTETSINSKLLYNSIIYYYYSNLDEIYSGIEAIINNYMFD